MATLVFTRVSPNARVLVVPVLCTAAGNVYTWIAAVGANIKQEIPGLANGQHAKSLIMATKDCTKKYTTEAAVPMALCFYSLRAQSWQCVVGFCYGSSR